MLLLHRLWRQRGADFKPGFLVLSPASSLTAVRLWASPFHLSPGLIPPSIKNKQTSSWTRSVVLISIDTTHELVGNADS